MSLQSLRDRRGQEVAVSDWRPITQADIARFADATDDHQWIHVDRTRAEASSFKATIAHGFLTLSLLSAWIQQTIVVDGARTVINYGLDRVRFVSAVPAGSRLRAHFTPSSIEEKAGFVQITWAVVVEREGSDRPACIAAWILRYLREPPGSRGHGP